MKLEHVPAPEIAVPAPAPAAPGSRRLAGALLAASLLWLLAWYGETTAAIVALWGSSDTYAHGYLIVPIVAWLVWQRRAELAALELRANLAVVPLLALPGAAWLVAGAANVGVVQQYSLALMIPLTVWAVLGTRVFRALLFPLSFLLLAVPVGESIESTLMEHTADFTVTAIRLTGIPVYREGQFFTLPSGSWSVVEACSGLRYLIASVTVGVLYAHLTYRSAGRRAAFVLASILVPIVANWLRAYMIVMIGHLSEMKYAVGVDHILYGWVFFGVVMVLLFWVGSFWREDPVLAPRGERHASPPAPGATHLAGIGAAAAACAVMVAAWPAISGALEAGAAAAVRLQPPAPPGGWRESGARFTNWSPRFGGAGAVMHRVYARDGQQAGLYIAYYRNQRPGAQAVSSVNSVTPDYADWRNLGESGGRIGGGAGGVPAVDARLMGPNVKLLTQRTYWIAGRYVANAYLAKLLLAGSRLTGRGDDAAVIVLYAPYGELPEPARRTLRQFGEDMLPAITGTLEHARGTRAGS
ncbi:MAG: exosortase A [Burkholderiales bacterium]|nr:exosortase A [Burkholderiales bacterium]